VDNIKMDLRGKRMGWYGSVWLRSQNSGGAFVDAVMNLQDPYNAGKFLNG
jgi:hypothetical protein